MIVGVDFDNTIVCYDGVFHKIASEKKLIPKELPFSKGLVRDYLRQQGREDQWTELQGYVYGARMLDAAPFPGALEFFSWCRGQGIAVRIISHRTRKPFLGPGYDLHQAAGQWIRHFGFYEQTGLSPAHVYFELTKKEKINRISKEGCDLFIDDLPEFLTQVDFPENVRRILFDSNNRHPSDDRFERAVSWQQIMVMICKNGKIGLNDVRHRDVIASLLSEAGFQGNFEINPLHGGFNNKVLRIDINGFQVCSKVYFEHQDDARDRMNTEFEFANFAWDKGLNALAQPITCDPENGIALYEFVPGRRLQPGDVTEDMVQQALDFYNDLNRFKYAPEAGSLPSASESCFSIASHLTCVDARINKLLELNGSSPIERQAVQFIHGDLLKTWKELVASVYQQTGRWRLSIEGKIPTSDRCLSPSDFGFHNAILSADGRLRFIDFEYAGWDDPAKIVCDFFCQPAVPVPSDYYDMFAETIAHGLSEPDYHLRRMELMLPVYRLKWCCILLNEFLPTGWERRDFADKSINKDERKEKQLNKARNALRAI